MKTYKKIDLFFNGDYLCSTNQSKTCKEAKTKYITNLEHRGYTTGRITFLEEYNLKHKTLIKARFSKE